MIKVRVESGVHEFVGVRGAWALRLGFNWERDEES